MSGLIDQPKGLLALRPELMGFGDHDAEAYFSLTGVSGKEREGRWTDGPAARVAFRLPPDSGPHVMLKFGIRAFVWGERMPRQEVAITANGRPVGEWTIDDGIPRVRPLFLPADILREGRDVVLEFAIPTCKSPLLVGINRDERALGVMLRSLAWQSLAEKPLPEALVWQLGRPLGAEARKTFDQRVEQGFWSRFVRGPKVLDIGYLGGTEGRTVLPIFEGATGVELDYPGYDGRTLPFPDNSQDAVHSSHCLEHIPDYVRAIQEWHRVTMPGGHIITVVPHAHLYERRRRPPSRWNGDHRRFYTAASLLAEFEAALPPNSYRVRYLEEHDEGYAYEVDPAEHAHGCYEIVLVVEKIDRPHWSVED